LIENLNLFESIIKNDNFKNKEFEIVFTKPDVLINIINNNNNTYYNNSFNQLFSLGFNNSITFKNIIQFHINLFLKIIKNYNRDLSNFNFYLSNLLNYNDSMHLIDNLFNNIFYSKKIDLEYGKYFHCNIDLIDFNNFFDFNFIYLHDNNYLL
jgi:hypothetical protein